MGQVFLCGIHRGIHTHLPGQIQAVIVDIGDDDAAGAGMLADRGGNDADGTGTGDQHILADEGEHQCGVGGVAEGIKEGHHILVQILINEDHIGFGDAQIFGKGTVPIHTHGHGVLAPLDVAVVAVAAAVAGDVTLARDPLTDLQTGDTFTQGSNLTHIFVANGHRGLDMLHRPGIPVVDMDIGAADGGFMNLDQYLTGAGCRHGNLPQFQAGAGLRFDNRIHHHMANTPCFYQNLSK